MTAPDAAPSSLCTHATEAAGTITELLDVLWERAKATTAQDTTPVSASQLRLMYTIDRQDGIRMRTVCRLLASSAPNISRMCDRLQAVGFLERLPCPDSGREITLRLSPAGKKHLHRIREQREAMLHEAIHNMPAGQQRALARGLTELAGQLTSSSGEEPRRASAQPAA
ncbi:MarR family transcriptional regulator [Streptomyces sp. MBT27]|uniref:MarR family winged helix-turn-helix transcriptional regulator n=1 Tax=Streptomyces sp. MBT27 TaxID=1488356 RepID=UPI00141F5452|nr:MarR family transcriptional regulator [Streptomyces sp. MBT27]